MNAATPSYFLIPFPIADTRALLTRNKVRRPNALPPLTVWCKKCKESHPSRLAYSYESFTVSGKKTCSRLAYPSSAGDVVSWDVGRFRTPPERPVHAAKGDAVPSEDLRTKKNARIVLHHRVYGECEPISAVPHKDRHIIRCRFEDEDRDCTLTTEEFCESANVLRKVVDRINPPVRKAKVSLKLVAVRIPAIELVHESFGPGFPFERANENTLWVHFKDGDRLVTTSGFLGAIQPVLDLFACQIVLQHHTWKQFKRKRTILVAEITSELASTIASVEQLASDLSEPSSMELIRALRERPHLAKYAVLDWTRNPVVGLEPRIEHCPTASAVTGSRPSATINSTLLFTRYYKGRTATPLTAKDMSESTYRFSDLEARRNAALLCDPNLDEATFESMGLEFYGGDGKLMPDPDAYDIEQIQTEWFSGLSEVNEVLRAVRTTRQNLAKRQLLLKYRRALEIARASVKIGHWELSREECRQRCNCSLPFCDCQRPKAETEAHPPFTNTLPCVCNGPRCICWKTVIKCTHQSDPRRPFGFCPTEFVEEKNGPEWTLRAERDIAGLSGYSYKQLRNTLRTNDKLIADNFRQWLRKEYGRPLPVDNRNYYQALTVRTLSYYRSTPQSVEAWADKVSTLQLSTMTPQQESTALLDAWMTTNSICTDANTLQHI